MAEVCKPHPIPLVQHLTDDGLIGGGYEMAVNGASTPVEFWIQPPAGWIFLIHRMILYVEDERAGFAPETYGAGSALTNGVTMQYKDDNQVFCHFMTDVEPITQNSRWKEIMYDTHLDSLSIGTPTNAVLGGRFTFTRFGNALVLDGDGDNQRFSMFVNDDLTGIVSHEVLLEGQAYLRTQGPNATTPRIGAPGAVHLTSAEEVPLWY